MAKIIIKSNDGEMVHKIEVAAKTLDNPLGVELVLQEIEEKVEDILLYEV